jgi:hypothetical protein
MHGLPTWALPKLRYFGHMIRLLVWLGLCSLCGAHAAIAQAPDSLPTAPLTPAAKRAQRDSLKRQRLAYDPLYIRPHKQGLTVQGSSGLEVLQVRFERDGQPNLAYVPNSFGTIGPAVYYNRLGVSVMFKNGANLRDPSVYGRSRFVRLEVPFINRHWVGSVYYQSMRGLYLPNPGTFEIPARDSLPPTPRPDALVQRLGFNYLRVFNPLRYSYSAVFTQSDQQLKTAGSFTLQLNAQVQAFGADSSLVPVAFRDSFPELNAFRGARLLAFGIAPGYAATVVVAKRLTFSAMFNVGAALQFQSFIARDTALVVNNRSIGGMGLLGLQMGYNAPRFYVSLWFQAQNSTVVFGPNRAVTEALQTNFTIGYRFPKVRILRNSRFFNRTPPFRGILNPRQGFRVTTTGSHQSYERAVRQAPVAP